MSLTDGPDGWIVGPDSTRSVTTPPPNDKVNSLTKTSVSPLFSTLRSRFHALRTNPNVVDKTPILSVFLLEAANVQQLYRMWSTWTAAGQSLTAWMSVNIALWLWLNFYYVFNKDNKFAIRGTQLGIVLNSLVILSVAFFRAVGR